MSPNDQSDISNVINAVTGKYIVDGGVAEDGMHIEFEDGTMLVISGTFLVGVVRTEKRLVN